MSPWLAYSIYAVFSLGALGIYLMLPRRGGSRAAAGASVAAVALLCLLIILGVDAADDGANVLFYIFAAMALGATARVITHPKPVYSAIYFVLTVVTVAAMMLLVQAEFLAIAVMIIYAGAILVTYVFVIMLAQQSGAPATDLRSREPFLAVCAGFVAMAAVAGQAVNMPPGASASPRSTGAGPAAVRLASSGGTAPAMVAQSDPFAPGGSASPAPGLRQQRVREGNSFAIGAVIMTRYLVALEIAAVLLLVAMVGAVALSRKRVPVEGPVEPAPPPGQAGREVPPY